MNRREARAVVGRPSAVEIPERLRRCFVEDWVEPWEQPPAWWMDEGWSAQRGRSPAEVRSEWVRIEAWTRWSRAQALWAKANGVPWSFMEQYSGDDQARWRTPPDTGGSDG